MQFCGKHHIGLHWSFTYTLVCVMMWKTNRIAKKRFSRLCVCPLSVTVFGDKHFSLCGFLPWCGVLTCQCSAGDLALFFFVAGLAGNHVLLPLCWAWVWPEWGWLSPPSTPCCWHSASSKVSLQKELGQPHMSLVCHLPASAKEILLSLASVCLSVYRITQKNYTDLN